jgi:hypothetical protein
VLGQDAGSVVLQGHAQASWEHRSGTLVRYTLHVVTHDAMGTHICGVRGERDGGRRRYTGRYATLCQWYSPGFVCADPALISLERCTPKLVDVQLKLYFVFLRSVRRLLVTANVPSLPSLVTLMMEALSSPEMSVHNKNC